MHRRVTLCLLLSAVCVFPGGALARSPGDHAAPQFAVRDLDGKIFRLSDYKGRPVVLDFWATWCVPCRATLPHLNALQERYRNQGLVIVGLSLDDLDAHAVRRFAERLQLKFRLGMADEKVLDLYGPIRSIPTTIFIDRKGRLIRRVVGYIDAETTETYALELF